MPALEKYYFGQNGSVRQGGSLCESDFQIYPISQFQSDKPIEIYKAQEMFLDDMRWRISDAVYKLRLAGYQVVEELTPGAPAVIESLKDQAWEMRERVGRGGTDRTECRRSLIRSFIRNAVLGDKIDISDEIQGVTLTYPAETFILFQDDEAGGRPRIYVYPAITPEIDALIEGPKEDHLNKIIVVSWFTVDWDAKNRDDIITVYPDGIRFQQDNPLPFSSVIIVQKSDEQIRRERKEVSQIIGDFLD
jgi:hypothetical protein